MCRDTPCPARAELRQQLLGHRSFPYSSRATDTWDALKEADADPNPNPYPNPNPNPNPIPNPNPNRVTITLILPLTRRPTPTLLPRPTCG